MTVSLLTPEGVSTSTMSPARWPTSALPTGDSIEILPSRGATSAEPTIWYCRLRFVSVSNVDGRAEPDDALLDHALVGHNRAFDNVLDLRYPRLDEGQFVLGFLVFGVIDASSGIVGRSDLRGNLPTAHVLKVRQLFFELLHALGSEVLRVSVHR